MKFRILAMMILLFAVACIFAQDQGPLNTPRINSTYYVGSLSGLQYYPTIQSAVTDACESGDGSVVDIPPSYMGSDPISGVTGGCTSAVIKDEHNGLPTVCYTWQSTVYSSSGVSCSGGSGGSGVVNSGTIGQAAIYPANGTTVRGGTLSIGGGGTNATTAAGALTNLGAMPLAGGTMTGPLTIGGVPPGTTSNNFLNIALPYIGVAGINCQNTNTGTTAVCEFTVSGSDSTSISNYGGFYRINIGATGHGVVVGGPGDVGLQSAGNNLQISPVNANLYLNYGADVNSMTPAISISSSGVIAFPELAASSGHVCVHLDTSGIMTNTGTDCSSGGGSGTVSSGTLYQEAGYSAAGTTVSGATPIHVNASRISGFVSDGSTDVTSVLQTWLTGNCRILDIPWDGVTGHCAEISSPLQITCAGGGIWGSGKSTSGNGGLCTKKPNIDLIQPYNAGGDPGAISIHNMNLSYTGTAASGATATATVSTGAGAAVTGFTVTNGGTNYYATPGISVIGCNNVQVLATLSSGVITALSPASGSAAQGTLVSSGSTGSCINTASAAYQWVSAASYLRYHPIVVNVSGTNYVYEATTAVASATTQPSCTTLYCTSSDGSGVWTNEGVFGSVAIVGGSTGDSTGQASTGWGIDATGISSYNGAYLDIDNVSVWNMGGAVRANGASINRIHNVTGNTNQDGNGYCYANTAGSPQSDDLWGVSCTGSAGWSGYMSGQGYSATLTCIISCTQQIQYVN